MSNITIQNSTECFASGTSLGEELSIQFHLIQQLTDFEGARLVCQNLALFQDGNLASITSDEENRAVIEFLNENSAFNVYIGLFDDVFDETSSNNTTDRFRWIDNSQFSFGSIPGVSPWKEGEPNNGNENEQEDCGV